MATIDDKVVAMSFESAKFEDGIAKSISALDKLKAALQFKEHAKSLVAVGNAAHQVDLGHIAKGAEDIKAKLGALNVAAVAIFADIAKRAVATGAQIVSAFTIEPAKAGFAEYTTNLNSIQTILANTQAAGATLKDVNAALDELNDYSDKTIYNFGQMARNIGTFTAAGVDLKTATASIKGIANLAALSGSNAEQAATAMYQLSQAISSGSVKLMDWNSVVNAGMGGTVFQRALAQTGEHMGRLKEGTVQLVGPMKNVKIAGESFRNSLSAPGKDGWLTSDVLTKTLSMLTGDMTDAELAADGWNKAQIKAIQAQAKAAMLAATNVKTLDQVLKVAKETAGSGWAKTWRIIFGDFEEAKKTFTNLSNAINGMIIDSARARNNMLGDWKALGGRKVLIEGIKEAFHNLSMVLKPIKDAFREFFPRATGKQLYDLTVRFKEFAETLKPSPETVELLRRTFRGFFAVLDIGKEIIFGLFGVLKRLFGAVGEGSGSFLSFTATIGDALVTFHDWLIEGGKLAGFFDILGDALSLPIKLLGALKDALSELFSGGVSDQVGEMAGSMNLFQRALEALGNIASAVLDQLGQLGDILEPVVEAYVSALEQLGPAMANAVSNINFEAILQIIRTGLIAGIFLLFKNFLGKGAGIDQLTKGFAGIGGGILKNISGSFAALTGSLNAMQQNLKAKTLKEIALAVALLAVSMVALSFVDPKRLQSALGAITIAFGQLLGAMAILGNVSKSLGFIKMPVIAATLIVLAGAIFVLSASVIALSFLSWEQLVKGLGSVVVLLGALVLATGPLSAASFGMLKAGIGIQAIAVGLNILALAVLSLGSMSLTTLGKGLASIGISLLIIAGSMKLMPKGPAMIAQGAALMGIAVALNVLALAIRQLGSMDLKTLGKGIGAIALSLALIGDAMKFMPKGMILQAAGLVLVAVALQGIARAVGIMGGMSLVDLAKGLGALAVSLTLIGLALIVFSGSIGGAIALGIAAAGIALLVPALVTLGNMKIFDIVKSLVAMAAAFAIIGGAAMLLTPAVPAMLGFGAALVLIGAGLALAGAGVFLIGLGLAAVAASGSVAVGVLIQALTDLTKALIENAKLFALGILSIVQAFAEIAPQFVDAIVKMLSSLIDAIIQLMPKLEELIIVLIQTMIRVLDSQQGPIIQAAFNLLLALLSGIRNNIGQVVQVVIEIVQALLNGIARNIGKLISAGANVVIALLRGIANNLARIVTAGLSIITKFLGAIANNLGKIVTAGGRIITSVVSGIAKNIGKIIKAGTDVIVSFIKGIGDAGPRVIAAATNTIIKLINALSTNSVKLADAGAKAIINFLNGIAEVIENREGEMMEAGFRIGVAVIRGFINGLGSLAGELAGKVKSMGEGAISGLRRATHTDSPSKDAHKVGQAIAQGLANGMSDTTNVVNSAMAMGNAVIDSTKDVLEIRSPSEVMKRIGREVTRGFAEGIKLGTEEDTRGAFAEMRRRLAEQETLIRQQIKRREELQAKGTKRTKEETAELRNLVNAIGQGKKALEGINRAQTALNKGITVTNRGLKVGKDTLLGYAKQVEGLTKNIEIAQGIFEGFKSQFTELPEFSLTDERGKPLEDPLGTWMKALGDSAGATEKFAGSMGTLKEMGLDDKTYEALLRAGPAAQKFVDQLIAGGPAAVTAINGMNIRLGKAATTLGNNAAEVLYDAGEEAAKGFVIGLQSQKTEIETLMNEIADKMVDRIKNRLKIKSPSKVFVEIGKLSMEGMAKGFSDSSGTVTDAVDTAGKDALTAMQQSMKDIANAVSDEIDVNPVISPILDLTQVKSKAAELAVLKDKFAMDAAYGMASSISTNQATQAKELAMAAGASLKFEQNNYSPEALSDIEIYRQTKNQLSQLKSALAIT